MYTGELIEQLDTMTEAVIRRRYLLDDDARLCEAIAELDQFQDTDPIFMYGYEPDMERSRR
jgi:hypothetical protein